MKLQHGGAAALALACVSCALDASSPVKAVAMAWDAEAHAYSLRPVPLTTLTSLRHLRGGAGAVYVGGVVRASAAAINGKGATVEALRRSLVTAAPADADLALSLNGNVAYAEDADSLQLITAFYHLEVARAAFGNWGLQTIPPAVVVAGAQLAGDDGKNPLQHAELYFEPLETHYLPAPDQRTQLPVAMNLGAMAHSLMHQAIALGAWANAPVPSAEAGDPKDPAANSSRHASRAMSEGLADFLAGAVTADARWLDHSDVADGNERALDQLHCGSAQMLQALPLADTTPYDAYQLGAVLSGALWQASQSTQLEPIARGALASLPRVKAAAANGSGKLGVADVLEAIVAATSADSAPVLCGLFLDRFAPLSVASLPSCDGVTPVKPAQPCSCPPGQPGCG